MIEKRYQVFVSSTYEDLREARQEVMQALLELDCIPAGMELFPAANDDQWTLIKRVIDACDYYIVISAGRYGSLGPQGISYTEMEYRYAVEKGKPVIGFLHKEPDKLERRNCDTDPAKAAQLQAFRDLIRTRTVRFWATASELGGVVSRSVIKEIKHNPGVGWIRADQAPDESLASENLKLRNEVDRLRETVSSTSKSAPAGTESLAKGNDPVELWFRLRDSEYEWNAKSRSEWSSTESSWNFLLATILPHCLGEATDKDLRKFIGWHIFELNVPVIAEFKNEVQRQDVFIEVKPDTLAMVLVQLRALGLIERSSKRRYAKDSATYWALTGYGEAMMVRLKAAISPSAGKKRDILNAAAPLTGEEKAAASERLLAGQEMRDWDIRAAIRHGRDDEFGVP